LLSAWNAFKGDARRAALTTALARESARPIEKNRDSGRPRSYARSDLQRVVFAVFLCARLALDPSKSLLVAALARSLTRAAPR